MSTAQIDARADAKMAITDAGHAAAEFAAAFDGLATFTLTDVLSRMGEHSAWSHRIARTLLSVAERRAAIRRQGSDEHGRPAWALLDEDDLCDAVYGVGPVVVGGGLRGQVIAQWSEPISA
jgi:hypothetical protein